MALVSANGSGAIANMADGEVRPKILDALQLIYNPHSTNQTRHEAQTFLDEVKNIADAPYIGFEFASQASNEPIVRHYGLSLLEDGIKHKWAQYSPEQVGYIRQWVLQLAQNVSTDDPHFLRNKVALLWVEVAKRCWAAEWMDMDDMLLSLWNVPGPTVHKELVLCILEMLSDEIFIGDDPVVALRESVLSKAAVDIFTPKAVLTESFPNRQPGADVRSGDDGWMIRISGLLNDCLNGDIQGNEQIRTCAIRSLAVFYSLMPWAIPSATVACECVPRICNGLASSNVAVQKVR